MNYSEVIKAVSEDLNIPVEVVDKSYKAYWLYIRDSIQTLSLKERNLTEKEFLALRPNFNIPSLGKLCCTYQRYLGVKSKFNYFKDLNKYEEVEED